MKLKKLLSAFTTGMLALSLAACGGGSSNNGGSASADGEVAIFWYTFGDTYLSSVRSAMNKTLNDAGIAYQDYDANASQTTQTEQIQTAITKGAKCLVVNIVDASSDDATQAIIDLAKDAELPLVFFNRSVSEEIVSAYDKAAYVGTDYTQAGHMEGEMAGKYILENFDDIDLNKDGEISYVMFKGQEGNMEADARTKYGVEDADKVLTEAGKKPLKFYDDSNPSKYLLDMNGTWSAQQGQELMQTALSKFNEGNNNMIEVVIANNDDMALGAIAALQNAGYNDGKGHTIPVFGVDATDAAKEKIKEGSMTGTIKQDAVGMAEAVVKIAQNLIAGAGTFDGIDKANVVGTWRVNIPYSAYSGE
ncbi:MAG: galactose ABC transporter substrate-binding protein [Bacillota bacterium]|nr:galactose ABC transporter substrate-binding protein [Bacillota bacterium]